VAAVLESAIGLVFVYLILSLVVSAANEGIASLTDRRAAFLEKGIRNLLGDVLAGRFYKHGLIRTLTRKDDPRTGRPAYLSAPTFSETLLDLVAELPQGGNPDAPKLLRFRDGLDQLANLAGDDSGSSRDVIDLQQVLKVFDQTASNLDDLKKKIEGWFNEAMGRVSGWYKRHTRRILWILGALIALGLNADTINIVGTLWVNPSVRTAVVDAAEKAAEAEQPPEVTADEAADAVRDVQDLQVPLGWVSSDEQNDPRRVPDDAAGWLFKLVGLGITTVAMTFGSPFWFDLLKRFVGLRSAGPTPPEPTSTREPA
jgi:hypothetical protein